MADNTGIEWTEATWNPFTGCTKVSPGCDNCYMFREYPRLKGMGVKGYELSPDEVQVLIKRFDQPLRWTRSRRIFVNSMSDTFHPDVLDTLLSEVMSVMYEARQHIFQVLTKRPGRAVHWWNQMANVYNMVSEWPSHIHLGTSVENQKYAPRIEVLARVPAPVKFVSAEPLLGPLDLREHMAAGRIQWLIVGGESGPGARMMDPEWARDLRDQAKEHGVPFFLKQLGGVRDKRSGDKAVLDGRLWQEFPDAHP